MLQIVNTSSTMGSWAVCPSSDSGHVHSLEILTCPPLWSLRGWKTTFRSCEQFQLLSIILFLQRLYWHHVLMDWPRLGGCWPWFGSDPEGKKQQPFDSIAEVLVLSEYPLILLWPMASYTFSLWSSQSVIPAPFLVMKKKLSRDIFLVPFPTVTGSWTLSSIPWRLFLLSPGHLWKEVKSLSRVQLFATLWSIAHAGSSVHGIFQARILEWVTISFSRGSSQPRDWTQVSHIAGRCFNLWATREARTLLFTLCL